MQAKYLKSPTFAAAMIILTASAMAETPTISADEKALCIDAIKELTNGKPSAEMVTQCNLGNLEAAVETAMTAQGN